MPSVAISSVAPSWLTSWRSTSLSISQATTNMMISAATMKASDVGAALCSSKPSPLRDPFGKARHGQRREQHHRALREVEDARGLEDQHEAQRHQRIQHARHQAADEGFQIEVPLRLS